MIKMNKMYRNVFETVRVGIGMKNNFRFLKKKISFQRKKTKESVSQK